MVGKEYFKLGRLHHPRQNKNLLYRHDNEPTKETKEEPLSFVLFESPFTSVSSSQQGPPPLVSLEETDVRLTLRALNELEGPLN
jgi:hypothetical protein